jgi:hypothetical protein
MYCGILHGLFVSNADSVILWSPMCPSAPFAVIWKNAIDLAATGEHISDTMEMLCSGFIATTSAQLSSELPQAG